MTEESLPRIGSYRLLSLIAEGGMARVYLAEKEEAAGLLRKVAIKRIHPHLADDGSFVERFISEARISLDLQHPNLIRIYGFEKIDDELLLVMEYIEGCDLTSLRNRVIPASAFRSLAAQAADALAALHAVGITHRDISPSNVLVDTNGIVKLGDMGIAVTPGGEASAPQDFGKRRYLSPDVLAGRAAGASDDMYSLALLLAECASGACIDDKQGRTDIKTLTLRMRGIGMEREAALLLRAAGLAPEKIDAAEFAAAMRTIAGDDKQALSELVKSCHRNKNDAEKTRRLPENTNDINNTASQAKRNTRTKILRLTLLIAVAGFLLAQVVMAFMLRENTDTPSEAGKQKAVEIQETQTETTSPVRTSEQRSHFGFLPLDAKPKALIRIDGQEEGHTPQRLKLAPGEYHIEFVWRDADAQEKVDRRRVFVQSGPNREIFVSKKKNSH